MISPGVKKTQHKHTHNSESKPGRAVPHYFLKIFLGRGLLIIFLAVHKEAFKYNIRASMNKDVFFPDGRNILDAYLDIVISIFQ